MHGDFFTLTRNVPVAAVLEDYGMFRWSKYELFVLPRPGHTRGSSTPVANIDGRKVAVSGDLIHSPGRVQDLFHLQYEETGLEGVDFSVYSLARLNQLKPELLCPSHGEPLTDPMAGISQLIDKLTAWFECWGEKGLTLRNTPVAVSPHPVTSSRGATSTFYAIITSG